MKGRLIAFVSSFEGLVMHPYKDCAGIDTIYYGHRILPNEVFNLPYTQEQADALLWSDLAIAGHSVLRLTKAHLTDNQFSALISFVFNLGAGCYQRSQLRMCINRGDYEQAANKFQLYCHAGGRVIPGLKRRRLAESLLFTKNS